MRLYEKTCRQVGLHGLHTFQCIATPDCTGNCLSHNLCLKQIRGVKQIQTQTHTHTHTGIVECDKRMDCFKCPVCNKTCCMKCKVHPYHIGMSCKKYKEKGYKQKENNQQNDEILASNLINEGAVSCPGCHEIFIKISGC